MIAIFFAATTVSLQAALDRRVAGVPGTGIVVGVIDHGVDRVYVAGSAGSGRPAGEHTLFEIGSVSKTFTATVLAAMVRQGSVRLSDPIARYLPAGVHAPAKDGKQITLLDLAEQRSGLPRLPSNMQDVMGDDPYAEYTTADMYGFLSGYALTREPGAAYEYSNYGVGLLGQLLTNAAGVTYERLVQSTVLDPLGMSETAFATTGAPDPPALAAGHDLGGGELPPWHFRSVLPAGGIVSSVSDMLKYVRCNMGRGPLARDCLFAQKPRAPGAPRHEIGLVWNVNSTTGVIAHDGDTNGFHAIVAVSRDRQTGVVALSNGPVVADIGAHVMNPADPIASCPLSVARAKTDPASYAGLYCNASSGLQFTVDAGPSAQQLSIALSSQPAGLCRLTDPDTCSAPNVGATFKFVRQGGNVVGLWLMQGTQTLAAVRLGAHGQAVVARLPSPYPTAATLAPAALREYVGSYASDVGTFTVTLTGDVIDVQLTGQPAVPVYPSGKDEFFYKIVDAQVTFNRDAAGAVTSLTLHQNGMNIKAARTPP